MNRLFQLIMFFILFCTYQLFSQPHFEWIKNYPMRGCASAMDSIGNVYIVGCIGNTTQTLKYNTNGNLIWQRNDSLNTNGFGIIASADKLGNVYFTAEIYHLVPGQGYTWVIATVKYDSTGSRKWIKKYSAGYDSRAFSMAVDVTGNVYVVGRGNLTGRYNYLTIKYNPQGDTLWTSSYLSPYIYGGSQASSVCIDQQNNVYITGSSINATSGTDFATIKYNSNGVQQWVKIYDSPNHLNDGGSFITCDKFGNSYVSGSIQYDLSRTIIATIKYAPSGDSLWTRLFFPPFSQAYEYGNNILLDTSLNIYVTGLGSDCILLSGFRIIKYNKFGNLIWSNLDSNYILTPYSSIIDKFNNIYLTGSAENSVYSAEYNSSGIKLWTSNYPQPIPQNGSYSGLKFVLDNNNNLYLFGSSLDSSLLIKYGLITNIKKPKELQIENFILFQNYPNPFNSTTNIKYQIKNNIPQQVTLKIYNILGEEIETLVNKKLINGIYQTSFNGEGLSSGLYYCSFYVNGNLINTKQMVLLK